MPGRHVSVVGTGDQAKALACYEEIIENGLQAFVDVGAALLRIREERLYRETHGTFEGYCRERWGFNRQRASQLILAADVSTNVDTAGLPVPANEGQARELTPLKAEPEKMAEAWTKARDVAECEGRDLTAQECSRRGWRAPSSRRGGGVAPGGICPMCTKTVRLDHPHTCRKVHDPDWRADTNRKGELAEAAKQRVWMVVSQLDGMAEGVSGSLNVSVRVGGHDVRRSSRGGVQPERFARLAAAFAEAVEERRRGEGRPVTLADQTVMYDGVRLDTPGVETTITPFDGRAIRRARCELGLTRDQLGMLVGVGKYSIRDWEVRGHRPAENVRYRLARLLDLSLGVWVAIATRHR